jgi:cob(I)alamin adenosyltransferase
MSIVTKTGDDGTTGLMFNRRVPKTDPRVEAYGTVDELNAALGLARATAEADSIRKNLLAIQQDLVALMGELATVPEDFERYRKQGYAVLKPDMTARLEELVRQIESQKISLKGWATPGNDLNSAALDLARTACRRAERRVCGLQESGQLQNKEALLYLNRLSDLLWLLARWAENQNSPAKK